MGQPLPLFPDHLIEDLDHEAEPQHYSHNFWTVVVASLTFTGLAALALWSGFQYEASRWQAQPAMLPPSLVSAGLEPHFGPELPSSFATDSTGIDSSSEDAVAPTEAIATDEVEPAAATASEPVVNENPAVAIAPPSEPPVMAAAPSTALPSDIRLVGILADAQTGSQALLMVNTILVPLSAGSSIEGDWYVAAVHNESVVISNGQRSHTLQLGLTGRL